MATYVVSKVDGNSYCVTNGQFMRHLRDNQLTRREYHEMYVTGVVELCPYCLKPKTFVRSTSSYGQTCGSRKCCGLFLQETKLNYTDEKNAEINKKRSETVLAKYGVEHVAQTPEVISNRKKLAQAIMPDGRTSNDHRQEQVRATKLARYGDQYYNNKAKIKESKARHTPEQITLTNSKRASTNQERYGIDYIVLSSNIITNSMKGNNKIKDFKFPSGRTVGIRGAEPKAIKTLLSSYTEEAFLVADFYDLNSNMPIIKYIDSYNRHHRYYPDIYIPKEKRIIEVKSRWWYDGHGKEKHANRLERNQLKRQASLAAGYQFEFWIYERSSSLTVIK